MRKRSSPNRRANKIAEDVQAATNRLDQMRIAAVVHITEDIANPVAAEPRSDHRDKHQQRQGGEECEGGAAHGCIIPVKVGGI